MQHLFTHIVFVDSSFSNECFFWRDMNDAPKWVLQFLMEYVTYTASMSQWAPIVTCTPLYTEETLIPAYYMIECFAPEGYTNLSDYIKCYVDMTKTDISRKRPRESRKTKAILCEYYKELKRLDPETDYGIDHLTNKELIQTQIIPKLNIIQSKHSQVKLPLTPYLFELFVNVPMPKLTELTHIIASISETMEGYTNNSITIIDLIRHYITPLVVTGLSQEWQGAKALCSLLMDRKIDNIIYPDAIDALRRFHDNSHEIILHAESWGALHRDFGSAVSPVHDWTRLLMCGMRTIASLQDDQLLPFLGVYYPTFTQFTAGDTVIGLNGRDGSSRSFLFGLTQAYSVPGTYKHLTPNTVDMLGDSRSLYTLWYDEGQMMTKKHHLVLDRYVSRQDMASIRSVKITMVTKRPITLMTILDENNTLFRTRIHIPTVLIPAHKNESVLRVEDARVRSGIVRLYNGVTAYVYKRYLQWVHWFTSVTQLGISLKLMPPVEITYARIVVSQLISKLRGAGCLFSINSSIVDHVLNTSISISIASAWMQQLTKNSVIDLKKTFVALYYVYVRQYLSLESIVMGFCQCLPLMEDKTMTEFAGVFYKKFWDIPSRVREMRKSILGCALPGRVSLYSPIDLLMIHHIFSTVENLKDYGRFDRHQINGEIFVDLNYVAIQSISKTKLIEKIHVILRQHSKITIDEIEQLLAFPPPYIKVKRVYPYISETLLRELSYRLFGEEKCVETHRLIGSMLISKYGVDVANDLTWTKVHDVMIEILQLKQTGLMKKGVQECSYDEHPLQYSEEKGLKLFRIEKRGKVFVCSFLTGWLMKEYSDVVNDAVRSLGTLCKKDTTVHTLIDNRLTPITLKGVENPKFEKNEDMNEEDTCAIDQLPISVTEAVADGGFDQFSSDFHINKLKTWQR